MKMKNRMRKKLMVMSTAAVMGVSLFASSPLAMASAGENNKKEKKPRFEFGLVADAQYCDCEPAGTRFYRESLDKLSAAAQTLNQHNLAFTVQLGDIIDRDVESFSEIIPVYNQIEGKKYSVLGNHDFPVPTDKVIDILEMPKQYYDFSHKGFRFVVLDTNDLSLYANPEGSEKYNQALSLYEQLKASGAENAQTWNGGLSQNQITWLEGVLKDAEANEEKVIVFGHMPIYPKNNHNEWNDEYLIKVMESAGNVVAYFNGHNHVGNYARKNGIYYVNFQGMVETEESNAYSVIKIFKDRIEIDGFGREPDRVLDLKKIKEHK
ncbi:metallophosphoesterase [Mesobacillus foraminis]|uniref:metallophosphoesterase n=1 Tax=Mesobacillus foraminis TaxID=279826 RepID=UPI000EF496B3|nr:metallophosphoesterase [Mesobacillus foraminis]